MYRSPRRSTKFTVPHDSDHRVPQPRTRFSHHEREKQRYQHQNTTFDPGTEEHYDQFNHYTEQNYDQNENNYTEQNYHQNENNYLKSNREEHYVPRPRQRQQSVSRDRNYNQHMAPEMSKKTNCYNEEELYLLNQQNGSNGNSNVNAAEKPKAGHDVSQTNAARHLHTLELKQKAMESSMRRLLRSMRDLKVTEKETGFCVELDKRRRLKLTRMIQILMLQRRNMQLQNDTLRKEVITLTRKFMALRKRAERLVVENVNMRKHYCEIKADNDKKTIQIENLLQGKVLMQKEVQDKVDIKVEVENLKFEIKRLLVENHNLKESLQKSEDHVIVKTKEKEHLELENSELRVKLIKLETEEANIRLRFERLTFENERLSKECDKNQNNTNDINMVTFEYDQLREKYQETLRNMEQLERLYMHESEQRKLFHNQLQEVRGNIRVLCRVKPTNNDAGTWTFKSTDKILVPTNCISAINKEDTGCFTFNRVFRPSANQEEVFEEIKPLLHSCLDGYNVCIMAYGPTGSGKTYTMQGTRSEPGITLRAITELSQMIQTVRGIWDVTIMISMLEIYNEVVYDLLNKRIQAVRLCDDGTDVRLMDIHEKTANTEQELLYFIAKGHKRRKMAETSMNLESSRSHLIIRIQLTMKSAIDQSERTSSLLLCDLAGSESAECIQASGKLAVETGYINKSLVVLARVFEAIRQRPMNIPYRESKLTHILKPCLGGQAKCALIVAVTADSVKLERNVKALHFGARAMQVAVGKPKQNNHINNARNTPVRLTSPSVNINRKFKTTPSMPGHD